MHTMNEDGKYYAVFTEWLYPTESGRDFLDDFDTEADALEAAKKACEDERMNYGVACGAEALPPSLYADAASTPPRGYCLTAKNGLDEWWFAAKVIPVAYGMEAQCGL